MQAKRDYYRLTTPSGSERERTMLASITMRSVGVVVSENRRFDSLDTLNVEFG